MAATAAALVAACGGDNSDPREQQSDAQGAYFSGEAVSFDDTAPPGTLSSSISAKAKGTMGLQRTASPQTGPEYSVSGSGLAGPYLVSAGFIAATTAVGHTNATFLTGLQASVLLGQDALKAFASYGQGGTSATLITGDNLKAAQAKVTAFFRSEFDITVESGDADFVTSSFDPVPGDPMYDTLLAIDAKRREIGSDAFDAKTAALIQEAGNCLRGKVGLTIGGSTRDFCPSTKTAERETADKTIIDYVFTALAGDAITVRVQGNTVLDARYSASTGGKTATCSGKACAISLGAPDPDDETRAVMFAKSTLAGSAGSVVVDGTLVGAQPGVVLPTLPCSGNYFFLVLPDRSVLADCTASTASTLGLVGSFGNQQGGAAADAQIYAFDRYDPNLGFPRTDDIVTVNAVVEKDMILSVTVTRSNPATSELTLDYKCRLDDCNGVTIGPETQNSDSGFNATLSTLTFDRTRLSRVDADGSLATDEVATLTGTFNTVFIAPSEFGVGPAVQLSDCANATEVVSAVPSNEPNVYAICPELSGLVAPSANALTLADGSGTRISFPATIPLPPIDGPITIDYLTVDLDNEGRVTQVTYSQNNFTGGSLLETFRCLGDDCTGVTVSAPDAGGNRSVTFKNTPTHVVEADGFATDPRTARLDGRFEVPPALPEVQAASPRRRAAAAGSHRR